MQPSSYLLVLSTSSCAVKRDFIENGDINGAGLHILHSSSPTVASLLAPSDGSHDGLENGEAGKLFLNCSSMVSFKRLPN